MHKKANFLVFNSDIIFVMIILSTFLSIYLFTINYLTLTCITLQITAIQHSIKLQKNEHANLYQPMHCIKARWNVYYIKNAKVKYYIDNGNLWQ